MIVNKRKKLAQNLKRADLAPRELTERETFEAFDLEIALRIKCIEVLESTAPEMLKIEDEI